MGDQRSIVTALAVLSLLAVIAFCVTGKTGGNFGSGSNLGCCCSVALWSALVDSYWRKSMAIGGLPMLDGQKT